MSLFSILMISCTLFLIFSLAAPAEWRGGVTVDLIHRDSPLSPFYDPNLSHFDRIRNSFARSFSRHSNSNNKIAASIASNGGEYLMKIGIGTPPVEALAIADTGSDLTWLQCAPCTNCYNHTAPPFDPTKTSTYQDVPCTSRQCQALGSGASSCDATSNCLYQMSYGDNSYSNGNLASETLTFEPGNATATAAFPNVVFGCGHTNQGTFDSKGSGIIGLGGGALSIVQQLNTSIGGKFSYCLTSVNSNESSKISFGTNALVVGPNVSSTPLFKKSVDTFYYLTLTGITVGNNRIQYKYVPTQPGEMGNIIIDSGTTLTLLPSNFYAELEGSLARVIKGNRVDDPQGTFHLCYEMSGNVELVIPPITMHFKGADVAVPNESIFVEVSKGVACLTFVPVDDVGMAIFGNLHQVNFLIGYDLVERRLSFLPTDCTKIK